MTAGPLFRRIVLVVTALGITLAVAAIAGGQMGLFSGHRPQDLGLKAGKLRDGDWRPNWVSSQVATSDTKHYIAPLKFPGPPGAAWEALEKAIRAAPGSSLVSRGPDYLHAEFASRVMGFVDDAEFALEAPAGQIHVRAGARLGVRDFSVNRERIEAIRAAMAAR